MADEVRYCTTQDGVRIAYTIRGNGFPIVNLTPFIHSFALEQPAFSHQMAELRRSLIRYDIRGTGLSQRNVADFSLEAKLSDLEAVVRAAGLERFDLFGVGWSGPVAIAYAARHPEELDHLILYGTSARTTASWEQLKPMIDMARDNWRLASQLFADFSDRDRETDPIDADLAGRTALLFRQSADGKTVAEFLTQAYEIDVTDLLPSVTVPALVLHRRSDRIWRFSGAQDMAARLPNARLVPLEGRSLTATSEDEALWEAVFAFLGAARTGRGRGGADRVDLPSGTAVILFADIADSTALTERLGDAAFRDKARELDAALRRAISSNGGTAIEGKLLGDGVLATFGAAREAIACAQELHRLAGAGGGPDPRPLTRDPLLLHVGIHAGDVIRESNNVYGGAVNIASRVASEAAAGETLVSGTVRDLARTSAGVAFEDRGKRELKGVSEPVRVFAVREA